MTLWFSGIFPLVWCLYDLNLNAKTLKDSYDGRRTIGNNDPARRTKSVYGKNQFPVVVIHSTNPPPDAIGQIEWCLHVSSGDVLREAPQDMELRGYRGYVWAVQTSESLRIPTAQLRTPFQLDCPPYENSSPWRVEMRADPKVHPRSCLGS